MKKFILILLIGIGLTGCACQHKEVITPIPNYSPNNQYCKKCHLRVTKSEWTISKEVYWKKWWWK